MKLSHLQAILFPVTLKLGQGYPTTITHRPPPRRFEVIALTSHFGFRDLLTLKLGQDH